MPTRIDLAIAAALHHAFNFCDFDSKLAAIRPSEQDGVDYQCDSAIRIAKSSGMPGPVVAQRIVDALPDKRAIEKAWVTGPGFINLRASDVALIDGLGAEPLQAGQRAVLIDFGGPNVAKPLHVGHLRTLAIGESLRRILVATGHAVVADIHLGDFGLQMGQLIALIEEQYSDIPLFGESGLTPAAEALTVADLEKLYPAASTRCQVDPDFRARSRTAIAKLQAHAHAGYVALWHRMRELSLAHQMHDIKRLDARFDLLHGESDVAADLAPMIAELVTAGIAVESEGAIIIHVSVPEDGKRPMPPLMLKTRDGSYTYAATDLATLKVRLGAMAMTKVIYVTDDRQIDHFTQLARVLPKIGIAASAIVHVPFGTVNDASGKPFKTRDGGTAKLADLIDQAIAEVSVKSPGLAEDDVQKVAVGAIKYADLVTSRTSGYSFDIAKATATEGKTGVYLQYAAVRIRAILSENKIHDQVGLPTPAARTLAAVICRTPAAIDQAFAKLQPHVLANHGWTLAAAFNALYAETRILDLTHPKRSAQLVWLCRAAYKDLTRILDLLGIAVPDRM